MPFPYGFKACLKNLLQGCGLLDSARWLLGAGRWLRNRVGDVLGIRSYVALKKQLAWLDNEGGDRIPKTRPGAGPRRIVMLVVTNLQRDPRVEREARVLAEHGFQVTVLCPRWSADANAPDWGPGIAFRLLPIAAARFRSHFPWLHAPSLLEAALQENAWAYHAHDLDVAVPALLAAAQKQVLCVCDFHEWYSENVTYHELTRRFHPHGATKKRLFRAVESLALRHASAVVTVCDSIARLLEREFHAPQPVAVIRNIPSTAQFQLAQGQPDDVRRTLGIGPEKKIVLYQGLLGASRNLEPVLHAMVHVTGAVLVLRGPGHDYHGADYLKLARRLNIQDRVFCLGPVPSQEVVLQAQAADFGLWTLLGKVGRNFELALPNKLFEYLAAGLPILGADLPEARKIIQGYQVGACFDPDDPRSIARAIQELVDDPQRVAACRNNITRALADLQPDKEWRKLVDLYQELSAVRDAPGVSGVKGAA